MITERVDLCWIVKRLLKLLDAPDAKVAEKVSILDRLRDLILLVALQDEDLAKEMSRRIEGSGKLPRDTSGRDPFNVIFPSSPQEEAAKGKSRKRKVGA